MLRKSSQICLTFLLVLTFLINVAVFPGDSAYAQLTKEELHEKAQKTIQYYHDTYKEYEYQGILDWPALGLFAFGEDISGPKWTVNGKNGAYWREEEVKQGIGLRKVANTDYQRTIIAVCAAGKDPRNFGGLNLVEIEKSTMLPSGHFADSVADRKTGKPVGEDLVNAHIFGIIALHCAGEPIPNRDKCLEWLEKQQLPDGGFTWDVKDFDDPKDYELVDSDVDMTAAGLMGMAILGEDESNPAVKKALAFLKKRQLDNGGFESWGTVNPESCAWVIQALRLLGQDPMGPKWTTASGGNPVSALLEFQLENGAFTHVLNEEEDLPVYDNGMSTYEALYGMADAYNKKAAYDMLFEKYRPEAEKHLFRDFKPGNFGFRETSNLVYDYVLSGYPDGTFKPEKTVSRAEFAKFLVFGLDYKDQIETTKGYLNFIDVDDNHWAKEVIGVCVDKGLLRGLTEKEFAPNEEITGEQLMAVLVRALGLEEEAESLHKEGESWSYGSLQVAKEKGLMYEGFEPSKAVTRAQCAWCIDKLRNFQ